MSFTVAIVGRPNVGKSTLFNRLVGLRKAIVHDVSGVTRDRQYGLSDWNGKTFNLIDTGGFVPNSDDVFEKAIRSQVEIAMEEASLIIFMVDVVTGITDLDDEMAKKLRRTSKPVFLAVNKVDNHTRLLEAQEFYSLGFEHTFFISSITGGGSGELLDALTGQIPSEEEETESDEIPKFSIIGQPNVGKSTLLNALIGQDRNIVTDIAGTTRDSIHTRYNLFNNDFLLIDTAGIRKKSKVDEDLEFYSVIRAIKAMDEADVCILLLDATMGIEGQDVNIFSLAQRKSKGIVVLVNKWDLIEKDNFTTNEFEKKIRLKTAPFADYPIVFISALDKQRIFKGMQTALDVYKNMSTRIPTAKLNDVMQKIWQEKPPPSQKGKYIKIKYVTQIHGRTPIFAFFCNHPKDVKEAYKNFLENQLRANFNFHGVPIRIFFRQK